MLGSIHVSDIIDERVSSLKLGGRISYEVSQIVRTAMRKLIYEPDDKQRDYLQRLSRTYFLLFILRNEPRVIEYFNGMKSSFSLYIGSDIIIKALSESLLPPDMQRIQTTLKILADAGASMIVTEPAIEEVFSHIHGTCLEFENYYADIEPYIPLEIVYEIDKILIRSYFYARLLNGKSKPKGWKSFIGQFVNYDDVRANRNIESLKNYLCSRFSLGYETRQTMASSTDPAEVEILSKRIVSDRTRRKLKEKILADNDALHALRIYSRRQEIGDGSAPNAFGFKTWWLTYEKVIQKSYLASFGPGKPRFIIRPEFLLGYLTFNPSKRDVVDSYKQIFPSVLGVTLGRRLENHQLHDVLKSAREAFAVDEHRARAQVIEFANKLKADQMRIYDS